MKRKIILPIIATLTGAITLSPFISSCSCLPNDWKYINIESSQKTVKADASNNATFIFTLDRSDYTKENIQIYTTNVYIDSVEYTWGTFKIKEDDYTIQGNKLTYNCKLYFPILNETKFSLKFVTPGWEKTIDNFNVQIHTTSLMTNWYTTYESYRVKFLQDFEDKTKQYNKIDLNADSHYDKKEITSCSILYQESTMPLNDGKNAFLKFTITGQTTGLPLITLGGLCAASKIAKYNGISTKFSDSTINYSINSDKTLTIEILKSDGTTIAFKEIIDTKGYSIYYFCDEFDTNPSQLYDITYSKE